GVTVAQRMSQRPLVRSPESVRADGQVSLPTRLAPRGRVRLAPRGTGGESDRLRPVSNDRFQPDTHPKSFPFQHLQRSVNLQTASQSSENGDGIECRRFAHVSNVPIIPAYQKIQFVDHSTGHVTSNIEPPCP